MAHRAGVALAGDRENRQQSIAHEFEHFATVIEDRRHLAAEIKVQPSINACGGNCSDSVVKPRMSESQTAARIAST